MKQHILALAAAMLLSGCATIVGTETQSVLIDSQPPGARFTVQDENGRPVAEGYTPKTVILEKSNHRYFGKKHYLLMLESPGYVPVTVPIEARANLWYLLGNIPLLGLPGWLLVDPFYGGMYNLEPEHPSPYMNPVGARG
ncbi:MULTISPECIES: hypothetical protein [Pantoea]|jgi:uncharacterized protein YceK|nr:MULTISPECIES: hypothetical protein [Pantoea]ASN14161.1 hypothetical protein B7764_02790 [Pantoea ananatis]AVG78045.1 hypothetical protein B9Q16_19305 [Pantoea ananatis]ERM12474.1 hypothetical protein L585_20460 [Pantoea ananatis BRT175]MBA4823680.1 hypothetical protein [Pantoea ananatis]MCH9270809.1 hypothetical protein [Pantoea ananatis]